MKMQRYAVSAALALFVGLLANSQAYAQDRKPSRGQLTIGLDLLSGRITIQLEAAVANAEPPMNIDTVCPALASACIEQVIHWLHTAWPSSPAEAAKAALPVEARLFEPVQVRIKNMPLGQALRNLSHVSGVRIVPDEAALKSAKIDLDAPVSLTLQNTSVHTALQQLLQPMKLSFKVENGLVTIVPPCEGNQALEARNADAQRIFEIGERCRRAGDYTEARNCYQQAHRMNPTSLHGRVAIMRIIELEERMRETAEEQSVPVPITDPEQVFRDMRQRSVPLGLVEVSY
jgi:hypothetical protein